MSEDVAGGTGGRQKAVTGGPVRPGWVPCGYCKRVFLQKRGDQRYCSPRCADQGYNASHPVRRVAEQGELFKARGKAVAADRNPEMLQTFRRLARELALEAGEVCIDDVRARAELLGIRYEPGNWIGSVFNEPGWQFVRYRRATHASAHARPVGVWRLA
jgi:hypothetical protein